ncbi:hypothetical protein [uncultured Candidatus Kuenenia sp.]|uniref:hypothetical protein n=1 Tax=uncultured Candidatus Kuenenia sp. TaxID=1048336 RepID=UPI0002E66E3C|nr:hypothetical protein [uncultured Candidatus Kuenenia sp.]
MGEAIKMFSVILPFAVYEQLKTMARDQEVSVGRLIRDGAELMLKESNEKVKNNAGA